MTVSPIKGSDPALSFQKKEIGKLSEEFESLFLGLVLKSMRDSVQKSGLIDGGNAEAIYRSMLDEEYAKQMASQHLTGLSDQIADFLLGQEKSKGFRAYTKGELPEAGKKATIGFETLSRPDLNPWPPMVPFSNPTGKK